MEQESISSASQASGPTVEVVSKKNNKTGLFCWSAHHIFYFRSFAYNF